MGDWESIFKKKGKVFIKPAKGMSKVIRLMKKEKVKKVLDLGCGSGRHTIMLSKAGFDVYATDISKQGLKLTRKWLKESKLKAKLKQHSCYKKFPFKDNCFDAIISTQVINHNLINKIRYCISEIERVLKPKGIIFITTTKARCNIHRTKVKKIAPRTFTPLEGREKGLPHYLYNKELLRKDFKNFNILELFEDNQRHLCLIGKLKH
jgi:ubiquinone/menaquinone biosynthesis C-methylase UbiE